MLDVMSNSNSKPFEGSPPRSKKPIVNLLVLIGFASLLPCLAVAWVLSAPMFSNAGPVNDPALWPKPFLELMGDSATPNDGITVCALDRILDQRSITLVLDDDDFINRLIATQSLVLVDGSHPMADLLVQSRPSAWTKPDFDSAVWYATPEYGYEHAELVDLFLVCHDSSKRVALILHENRF